MHPVLMRRAVAVVIHDDLITVCICDNRGTKVSRGGEKSCPQATPTKENMFCYCKRA
ncbi:MAG: hypothetical protein IJ774_04995 [Selenomonadaceae bacterium]|nr:hypothetical protein [Selenomonadaceae bacterium]